MTRKILALFMCLVLCVACFAACSDKKDDKAENDTEKSGVTQENNGVENGENKGEEAETVEQPSEEQTGEPGVVPEQSDEPAENQEPENDNGFELDVKPLEEIDEETLKESAQRLGFTNEKLFEAVANAMDVNPWDMTQEDIDKIHYIGLGPDTENTYTVFVGYVDYVELCLSEASEDPGLMSMLNDVVMISEFNYNIETDTLSDLANFKNLEMFEIYDVSIDDVSFVNAYDNLIYGYFNNNGITDVSSLADYAPESLIELDFTGNDISDWTPLEHIKEKVLVVYDLNTGFFLTLDEYLKQKENPVVVEPQETLPEETTGEDVQEDAESDTAIEDEQPVLVDENGNPADFSSLFD